MGGKGKKTRKAKEREAATAGEGGMVELRAAGLDGTDGIGGTETELGDQGCSIGSPMRSQSSGGRQTGEVSVVRSGREHQDKNTTSVSVRGKTKKKTRNSQNAQQPFPSETRLPSPALSPTSPMSPLPPSVITPTTTTPTNIAFPSPLPFPRPHLKSPTPKSALSPLLRPSSASPSTTSSVGDGLDSSGGGGAFGAVNGGSSRGGGRPDSPITLLKPLPSTLESFPDDGFDTGTGASTEVDQDIESPADDFSDADGDVDQDYSDQYVQHVWDSAVYRDPDLTVSTNVSPNASASAGSFHIANFNGNGHTLSMGDNVAHGTGNGHDHDAASGMQFDPTVDADVDPAFGASPYGNGIMGGSGRTRGSAASISLVIPLDEPYESTADLPPAPANLLSPSAPSVPLRTGSHSPNYPHHAHHHFSPSNSHSQSPPRSPSRYSMIASTGATGSAGALSRSLEADGAVFGMSIESDERGSGWVARAASLANGAQAQSNTGKDLRPTSSDSAIPAGVVQLPPATDVVPHLQSTSAEFGDSNGDAASTTPQPPPTPSDFTILRVLGRGAYGKVYLVRHLRTSRLFAMKVLRKAHIVLHSTHRHTRAERQILEEVRHGFVVRLYYAFQTEERLYLVLGYAGGGELFGYLTKERMFGEEVGAFYLGEVLLALEHLHSLGIIYRDLKPENILLDSSGHVVLTDFGLSKVALDANTFCGSVEYMAPEIISEHVYDRAVDNWSFGVLAYDLLCGHPPFTGQNKKKVMEAILKKKLVVPNYLSSFAKDLLIKLLRKNPRQRLGGGAEGIAVVKKHPFFRKMDWERLSKREYVPPIVPVVTSPEDTSNFSTEFTSQEPAESPLNTPVSVSHHRKTPPSSIPRTTSWVSDTLPGGNVGNITGNSDGDSIHPGALPTRRRRRSSEYLFKGFSYVADQGVLDRDFGEGQTGSGRWRDC
ncbi:serine/threonine protein kinase psk1 [Gonapodya sp. JEL0774]|nr:serine/threonine protein kinase psk1 [Gonapodya sp. JEL0774]